MDNIKTVGDLRKLISNLDDNYFIDFRVRTKVPEDELSKRSYPYPYDTTTYNYIEFDDIGISDKVLCLGITLNE